jgi:hypothetical protein
MMRALVLLLATSAAPQYEVYAIRYGVIPAFRDSNLRAQDRMKTIATRPELIVPGHDLRS